MSADQDRKVATVFGGAGFLGRYIVPKLAARGYVVRVVGRDPLAGAYLQTQGGVGQIVPLAASITEDAAVARAVAGAALVVNLVGILYETRAGDFQRIQAEGAGRVARLAAAAGVGRLVHVSAIGADPASPSAYGRSKAEGEAAMLAAVPTTVILRPSVIFGPEDDFFNRFGTMARFFPVVPIVSAQTSFQPVYVGDVADAVATALAGNAKPGAVYELGGPEVKSFEALVDYVLKVSERSRPIVRLSFGMGKLFAAFSSLFTTLSLGLYPKLLRMTGDQVELLKNDNIVSEEAILEGRTLAGLKITPQSIEAVVPS